MIQSLARRSARWAERWVPDPFVIALGLTGITFVLAAFWTSHRPLQLLMDWHQDFWRLLTFGMQMVLILVTGHAFAVSPPVRRVLVGLGSLPRTPTQAVILVAAVALITGILHWGLALVAGGLIAREVFTGLRRKGIPISFPVLGAAAYLGLLVWHGGLSGSAPLTVATPGHFLADRIGVIPVSRTLFSPLNLFITGGLLMILPWVAARLHPSEPEGEPSQAATSAHETTPDPPADTEVRTPARSLERHPLFHRVFALAGLLVLFRLVQTGQATLNLNLVNWTMLFLGLWLHPHALSYVHAVEEAARGAAGIILQFPFYAGILSLMKHSGLMQLFAGWVAHVATPHTLPLFSFLSAAVVNVFVPSGGGQWAVQGPLLVEAARLLHVPYAKVVMALAYGDELTNMIQPFWALPLLGITGLRARDLVGYTLPLMLVAAIWMTVGLLLF